MYIIPGEHNRALLFGALLAYRIIYYLLPLVISAIMLFAYEFYIGKKNKQKMERIKVFRLQNINAKGELVAPKTKTKK